MARALAGRLVIELGSLVAAPFASHILGQLGAEVIKIEPPEGDLTRTMTRGGPGGSFIAYSRGKKSVCIDLKTAQGKAVFERLLARADVVVHNLAPSAAERLGISYETCRRVKPDIVYCHIQGYGEGPRHHEIASNPVIEAATGVMYGNRVDGRPMRLGPAYHDQFAGTYAVIGILAGLVAAKDDSKARCIELGLYETGLHIAARDLAGVQTKQQLGVKIATTDAGEFALPGYGAYETADARWVYIIMLSDTHWKKFCTALAIAPDQGEPYATMLERKKNRAAVESIVRTAVKANTYDEVTTRLEAAGVGFTEVKDFATVLDEPQAQVADKVEEFSFGDLQFQMPNFPFQYQIEHEDADAPPPLLGEHTGAVMRTVGYSDADIAQLLGAGAVAAPMPPIKWAPARAKGAVKSEVTAEVKTEGP